MRAYSHVSLFELNKFFPNPCPIVGVLEIPIRFVQVVGETLDDLLYLLVIGFLVMIQDGVSVGETVQGVCYLLIISIFGRL